MSRNPEYLGDGVYISLIDGQFILTTGHHDRTRADNVIVLEPEVASALVAWLKVWRDGWVSGSPPLSS